MIFLILDILNINIFLILIYVMQFINILTMILIICRSSNKNNTNLYKFNWL